MRDIGLEKLIEQLVIKIGIENELLTINQYGFIIPASNIIVNEIIQDIIDKNIDIDTFKTLILGIQWEPHPAQLEIVTQPLNHILIEKAMKISREYVGSVASRKNIKIFSGSVHPTHSNPFPINGTHISISVFPRKKKAMPRKFLTYVHNNIRNHIPELIALTANSPIIAGNISSYASSRLVYSRVLKPSSYATIKRRKTTIIPREKRALLKYAFTFTDRKKYEHKVVADSIGFRYLDVTPRGPFTNIIEDRWTNPTVSRVETRFLDNPSTVDYLIDITYILLGLALEAVYKLQKNECLHEKPNIDENRCRAIKHGINAEFLINGTTKSARECVHEMLERVHTFLDTLNIKLKTSLANGVPELEFYGTPKIMVEHPLAYNNIKTGRVLMKIQINSPRELITFSGKKIRVDSKTKIFGLAFPQYGFKWVEEEHNIVSRFTEIYISNWLLTHRGYIKLAEDDRIIFATSPVGQLIRLFGHIYNSI